MDKQIDQILHFWFEKAELSALPSEHITRIWFSNDAEVDAEVKEQFSEDYCKAVRGEYTAWQQTPRGCLALIILLDQFSRRINRYTPLAYQQDRSALDLCLYGIEHQFDHKLSLIERVFFYFPLIHSESADMQLLALRAYEILLSLSFPETRPIFEKFLEYAIRHQEIITRFGRFPHRNEVLGRPSTQAEQEFIKNGTTLFD